MPIWLTILLALGGSTLVSLIVTAVWRKAEYQHNRFKEFEKKDAEEKQRAEAQERQLKWEAKLENELIKPLSDKLDAIQSDLLANKNATVSSLRADMMLLRDQFRHKGYASGNDKAAWNQLYKDYSDLGGNHFKEYVDQWKEEVNKMEEN